MSKIDETRSLSYELTLNASADEVWKALTDEKEIPKWFALDAKVTPGKSGRVWLSWGPEFAAETPIEIWDEPKHFQTVSEQTKEDGTPRRVVLDYFIEAIDGSTCKLRLVHSGFGTNAAWDDEFDAIRDGWKIFIRNLRHYLEFHKGKLVNNSWTLIPTEKSPEQSWQALVGGLIQIEGEKWTINGGSLGNLHGTIDLRHDGAVIGGTCKELGDALVRFTFSPYFKAVEVTFLTYGQSKEDFETAKAALVAEVTKRLS